MFIFSPTAHARAGGRLAVLFAFFLAFAAFSLPLHAQETPAPEQAPQKIRLINKPNAVILGIVEGITEFLPISSTGHLLVTKQLLNINGNSPDPVVTGKENEAIDAYMVIIQFGAILAVLFLYFGRVRQVIEGVMGKNPKGLKLAGNLAIAFIPAAIIGKLIEKRVDVLFNTWSIQATTIAWFVGGLLILWVVSARRKTDATSGFQLDDLTTKQAVIIGLLQCVAMWPGTSRSLMTILGGIFVGLSMATAVEFSFLLGLITLSAATFYKLYQHHAVIHTYLGTSSPVIGIIFAGISAFIAVKWMISYLNRHGLAIFGYYRLAAAAAVVGLVMLKWLTLQ